MLKFLGVLVVLAVIVLGVGYYLGWFQFSTASGGGKAGISMEVDKDKIKADEEKAQEKLKDLTKGIGGKKEAAPANSEPR
jgi:hypothetical protein